MIHKREEGRGPVHRVSIADVAGPTTIIRTTVQAMTL